MPLADGVSRSLYALTKDAQSWYSQLAYAPDKGRYASMRLHQVLFNELVRVRQIVNDEAECELLTCAYRNGEGKIRNDFWMLKKNIVFLKDLLQKKVDVNVIPLLQGKPSDTIALTWPWHNPKTRLTYMAGTRFVRCKNKDTSLSYAVSLLNPITLKRELAFIAKKYAIGDIPESPQLKIKLFLTILKKWARGCSIIPYVFGGCSIGYRFTHNNFYKTSSKVLGEDTSFWKRCPSVQGPLQGIDCSGLVLRAAQLAGMPYAHKNTSAIAASLRLLTKNEQLEEGDIVWYNCHVMVVSDKKKNELIEAIGYESGYGKVHALPLRKVFEGITTYDDLLSAYYEQKPLNRLTASGQPYKNLDAIKIFKLMSIWS